MFRRVGLGKSGDLTSFSLETGRAPPAWIFREINTLSSKSRSAAIDAADLRSDIRDG
jgi:hypothetical protein